MTDENFDYLEQLEKELEEWDELIHKHSGVNVEKEIKDQIKDVPYETMIKLLMRPLKSKKELRNWIKSFLHIDLPDSTIDPDSTGNPLQMVWNLYSTAVHYDNIEPKDRYIKYLAFCSRGSFKTMSACIVELLLLLHTNRDLVHIGLILSQAKNAFNSYLKPFLEKPYIKDLVKNSILERSQVKNNKDNINEIHVIPLTMNQTSSLRKQTVILDELDKLKGDQVRAFENCAGMLTMTEDKHFPMEFSISSRDTAHGQIQHMIDTADRTGTKIENWNLIDITEYCPDERSGNEPIEIYIKQDTLISISKDEFNKKDPAEKQNYEKHWGLDGCLKNCQMFAACRGYLKNQTSKCKWLKPVENTQQAIMEAPSEDMAISQLLCRKPPKTGLVYTDFEISNNIKTPDQMYKIFTGEEPEVRLSIDDFIEVLESHNIPLYVGADAGFHNPRAILIAIDKMSNVYILKEYAPKHVDSQDFAKLLYDLWGHHEIKRCFPDPESPDLSSALKKVGFSVFKKVDKSVQPGIATVKGIIRIPATQITKFFVNSDCMETREEFGKYAYKQMSDGSYSDDPNKKFDHSMDAIRYVLHTLLSKSMGNLDYDPGIKKKFSTAKEINKQKLSPHEVAIQQGFMVNDNTKKFEDGTEKPKKKSTTAFDPMDF